MVKTSLLGRRASSQGRITRRVGALALALLGLTCLAVFTRHGWGRTELISSKDGGGVDNIYAETGVKPDAPQKPKVHHPHHPGITARAVTAAEYEAALGKDIHGNPLPKQAKATRQAKIAARDAAPENKEERTNEPENKKVPSPSLSVGALPAGWEKKYDHSKGKYFYINTSIKAISWNRPDAGVKAAKTDVKDSKKSEPAQSSASPQISSPPRDSRMAADLVQQPHFKSPSARNPIYEGTGNELNQALKYNKVAVASARQYYAKIAQGRAEASHRREQQVQHDNRPARDAVHTNGRKPQREKSHLSQLGDRAFFKFDPVKGSFFRYSPDKGAVARPGSIADTLSKYERGEEPSASSMSVQSRAVAQPPAFAQPRPQLGFTEARVALPNGDIVSARKHPAAMHAKPQFAMKRSIDIATHNTREYKAAAADASSALLNVARTVAMNAGYHPDDASHAHHTHATHAAAHPRSIEAHTDFQGRAMHTRASAAKQAAAASHAPHAPAEGVKAQKSGENKAEGSKANGQDDKAGATAAADDRDAKDKTVAPAAEESHVRDPDWEARKAMNQASGGYGQRTFYKYDPAKGDFYKFTPDAARNLQPATTFAPEARI